MSNETTVLKLHCSAAETGRKSGVFSLPVLSERCLPVGIGDSHTALQAVPIGHNPARNGRKSSPRRYFCFIHSNTVLPEEIDIEFGNDQDKVFVDESRFWEWQIMAFQAEYGKNIEHNELVLCYGKYEIGLRVGIEHQGKQFWWQWVQAEQLWDGPISIGLRAKGYIYNEALIPNDYNYFSPDKHQGKNGILCGELFLVLLKNGVINITARHINGKVYKAGGIDVYGQPVIGLKTAEAFMDKPVVVNGKNIEYQYGGLRLNFADTAALVSEEFPGKLYRATDEDIIIYRPYSGVRILGTRFCDDEGWQKYWRFSGNEALVPSGVSRTVRFSIGVNGERPQLARYIIPSWWYAHCCELWSDSVLPVCGKFDSLAKQAGEKRLSHQVTGYFEAGADWRKVGSDGMGDQYSWDGEEADALIKRYYLCGDKNFLEAALNNGYYFADVAVNHNLPAVRSHAFWNDISLAYQRVTGLIRGYFETADPYLLETAEGIVNHYVIWHKQNWPRRTVGRDIYPVRGLILLYSSTGMAGYLQMARDIIYDLISTQLVDGGFAQQSGVGPIHGLNTSVKPWVVGGFVLDVLLDFLSVCEDEKVKQSVDKICSWLIKRQKDDGSWSWNISRKINEYVIEESPQQKCPMTAYYLARNFILAYRLTKRADILTSLNKSMNWIRDKAKSRFNNSYVSYNAMRNLPFYDAHVLNASFDSGKLTIEPMEKMLEGSNTFCITTPIGNVDITFSKRSDMSIDVSIQAEQKTYVIIKTHKGDLKLQTPCSTTLTY